MAPGRVLLHRRRPPACQRQQRHGLAVRLSVGVRAQPRNLRSAGKGRQEAYRAPTLKLAPALLARPHLLCLLTSACSRCSSAGEAAQLDGHQRAQLCRASQLLQAASATQAVIRQ